MNSSRWAISEGSSQEQSATPSSSQAAPIPAPTTAPAPTSDPNAAVAAPEVTSYPADDLEDEFAQTRPPDDLFDDDFTPLEQPAAPEPVYPPNAEESPPEQSEPQVQPVTRGNLAPRGPRRGGPSRRPSGPVRTKDIPADPQPKPEGNESQQPRPERREAAVRGDRSGTGGLKREKLTEEELSAKLEAMKIKNASLMEKHARSQADEESFYAREALAAQKLKEERVNRQQMMGERERNRQRKLQAQGGREWDMEKDEKEFTANTGRRARRGAYGGITGDRQSPSAPSAPSDANSSQPRGGFRGRGGRRGRGGFSDRNSESTQAKPEPKGPEQAPPKATDFPELPAAPKSSEDSSSAPITLEFPNKKSTSKDQAIVTDTVSAEGKKSWADQVEGAE